MQSIQQVSHPISKVLALVVADWARENAFVRLADRVDRTGPIMLAEGTHISDPYDGTSPRRL